MHPIMNVVRVDDRADLKQAPSGPSVNLTGPRPACGLPSDRAIQSWTISWGTSTKDAWTLANEIIAAWDAWLALLGDLRATTDDELVEAYGGIAQNTMVGLNFYSKSSPGESLCASPKSLSRRRGDQATRGGQRGRAGMAALAAIAVSIAITALSSPPPEVMCRAPSSTAARRYQLHWCSR